jgi:hypothetical protein
MLVLSFQLISCATIFHGSTEQIEIGSNVDNTKIYVNEVYVGEAGPEKPIYVTIPKRGHIAFNGKRSGCNEDEHVVDRKIDLATFLGLLIDGGIISILLVDIIGTGAAFRSAQTGYFLNLECGT